MREFQLKITNEHLYNAVVAYGKEIGYHRFPDYDEERPYIQFWNDGSQTYYHIGFQCGNRFPLITIEDFFEMKPEPKINISINISKYDIEKIKEDCEILSGRQSHDIYEQILTALEEYN